MKISTGIYLLVKIKFRYFTFHSFTSIITFLNFYSILVMKRTFFYIICTLFDCKNYLLTVPAIQIVILILKQNKVLILSFNFALKFFDISWLLISYFNAKMLRFFDSFQTITNKEKLIKLKLFFIFFYTLWKYMGYKVTAWK